MTNRSYVVSARVATVHSRCQHGAGNRMAAIVIDRVCLSAVICYIRLAHSTIVHGHFQLSDFFGQFTSHFFQFGFQITPIVSMIDF